MDNVQLNTIIYLVIAIAILTAILGYPLYRKKPKTKQKPPVKKLYKYILRIVLDNQTDISITYNNWSRCKPITPFIKFIKWYYKRQQSITYRFDSPKGAIMFRRCDIISYNIHRYEQEN